jgi:nucleotide-binding universal stress UspA family protein
MACANTWRMVSIKKILVPIDFSEMSNHALDYAIDLAKVLGASVTVAHSYVIPVYAFPDGAIISSPELAAQLSDAAQKNLDAAVNTRKECGVELASVPTNGTPVEEVTRLAQELRADLIVMSTHGRHGLCWEHLAGRVIVAASPPPARAKGIVSRANPARRLGRVR